MGAGEGVGEGEGAGSGDGSDEGECLLSHLAEGVRKLADTQCGSHVPESNRRILRSGHDKVAHLRFRVFRLGPGL